MSTLSSLMDAGKLAFEIFADVYTPLKNAIEKGAAADVLRASLLTSIKTSETIAVARVEARNGGPVAALRVAALHLEDAAGDLEQLDQAEDAQTLRGIAAKYRAV